MSAHPQPQPYLSFDEYLAQERAAEERSEYVNGQILAMSGASREHETIVSNLIGEFVRQLKKRPCQVFGSNLRLWISSKKRSRYPDVSVVCGAPEFYPDAVLDSLLNPTVLIEVLSASTEAIDRGAKAEEYRSIESLQEYLLIAQERSHVEHYVRQNGQQWLLSEFSELDQTVELPSIQCQLALADIYDKLEFTPTVPSGEFNDTFASS